MVSQCYRRKQLQGHTAAFCAYEFAILHKKIISALPRYTIRFVLVL